MFILPLLAFAALAIAVPATLMGLIITDAETE